MLGCETLPSLLRAAAEEFGERPAYVEGDSTLSYAGLLDRVRGVAVAYVDSGLEPGDRVAIWAPNSTDWAVAALAVTYAGGTLVPLNSRYTASEVVDVLDHPASDKAPFGQAVRARTEAGGGWMGWVVAMDDLTDAEERLGRESVQGNRHRPDGVELRWRTYARESSPSRSPSYTEPCGSGVSFIAGLTCAGRSREFRRTSDAGRPCRRWARTTGPSRPGWRR